MIPCGHRVLVKPDPIEKTSKGGIVLAVDEKQLKQATTTGVLISVGMNAWKAFDDGAPWASIGDRVSYPRYGGKLIKDEITEDEYVLLNDEDILCVLKEGKNG